MPRVPTYDGPQVAPSPLRVSQDIRAPVAAFGGATAQATEQAGQQMGQVASLIDRRAEQHAKEDAELAAFNAYTEASQRTQKLFYEGDNAIYQRRGAQAMGSSSEASIELKRIGEETGTGLTSPYAKQQFDKLWARHQDSEMGAVSRHEAGQRQEYRDQTTAGILATSKNQATLRYNDPREVDNQIQLGELAINANTKGLPPEQVDAQRKAFRSSVHTGITLRMATDNPLVAQKYYQEHADDFTAEDNVRLQGALAAPVKRANARIEGDKVIAEVTETKLAQPSAIHAAVEAVESGGDGNAVSGKGAKGVMQVLDSTGQEVAGKLGIAWQPELMTGTTTEAKAYQRKIGGAYLDQQLEKYGGNRTLALAAYNAGPGAVDDWINGTNKTGKNPDLVKLGDPRTNGMTDAAWAAKIPIKETKQYVARVDGKIRAGAQDNIDLTRADEIVRERFADDPEKQDAVTAHIQRQNSLREQALRDRQQTAWTAALQHIENGGSVDNLPPDVQENLAPGRIHDLEAKETARIRGQDKPENPKELDRLMAMSVTDPEKFLAEDPTKWDLPRAQVTSLIGRKAALMTKEAKEEAKTQDIRKAISLTSNLLRAAKIDPTPKDDKSKDAEVMNAYTARLMERLDEFKAKEGRRATDAEVIAMGQDLLLPGRLRDAGWFYTDPATRAFQVTTPEQRAQFYVPFDAIPAQEKADITAKLGPRATNDTVEQVYAAVRRGDKAEVLRLIAAPAPAATGGARADTVPNPIAPPGPGATVVPVR